jgi:hypothetical protein
MENAVIPIAQLPLYSLAFLLQTTLIFKTEFSISL